MIATAHAFLYVLYVLLRNNDGEVKVPQHVIDALAETFLPDIIAAFVTMYEEDRQMQEAAQQSTSQPHVDQLKK